MYLKKFIYVNWGNIPHAEFDFGPVNLLSGGNGSGKTTAADAIQTVMTAAHDNLFHFNPGQDESTQRGRGGKQVRTLASYVLGCDDGAYARPQACDGYLAAVFAPTNGEDGEPFTALLAMRAFVETSGQQKIARLDDSLFFILPEVSLCLADLVKSDKGGRYVVPMDRVYTQLRKQFGNAAVEKYDKKKAYLCRLYGVLRGRRDAVSEREAMNAARAFSRFMAYKPIKGIDEFVSQEVLEPRDLGDAIRDVSAMLKRIHAMEGDARQLREATERLQSARDSADRFVTQWLEQNLLDYSLARSRYVQCQGRYLKEKTLQQAVREQVQANERDTELGEARRKDIRQRRYELDLRRLQVPALRDKDQLEQGIAELEQQLAQSAPGLLQQDQQLQRNRQAAAHIHKQLQQTSLSVALPALADKALGKTLSGVASDSSSIDFHALFTRDWIDISPLENHLDEALAQQQLHNRLAELWLASAGSDGSLRDLLAQERDKRRQSSERLQRRVRDKETDIELLEQRRTVYPGFVRHALELLQRQLPQADARVLCDYVEVVNGDWQSAIEGYIGGNRFGIIVEEDYEAEAIRLLRREQAGNRGGQAKVIQGSKARRDAERIRQLPDDSIVHVMQFGHAVAEAYLTVSYGQVQRVADGDTLRNTHRGVTQDGMGSGNYAMFRCDIADSELVFGQAAREKALQAKRNELSELQIEWQQSADHANECQLLLQSVDQLKSLSYADKLQAMLAVQRKLQQAEESLRQLDLSDFTELEAQLEQLAAEEKQQEEKLSVLNKGLIDLKARLTALDKTCHQLGEEQDHNLELLETAEDNLRSLTAIRADFDAEQQLALAEQQVQAHNNPDYFANAAETLAGELTGELNTLQKRLLEHNQHCQGSDALAVELDFADALGRNNFRHVCDLQRQLDALYNRFKNNILARRYEELSSLRESFNNAFVTNLCHSIYQAINDGEHTLKSLNKELQHHRFGADRESFEFGWEWLPEFREYWQFFKAVMDNPSLGDGETLFSMELSSKHQQVRDRLMAMLLDEDEDKALRELARIADYRNYRRYEIYKKPEGKAPIALSQYGTGSGGQLETPAYIIRSAAITSAFRFNEGKTHLRMVLVDEAFSKMDEHRSKEVIRYLTESLGLQLMFIMPTSKSGPFMDLISNQFVFSKVPTTAPVGELHTRVLVDRQQCNKEKIAELMANHRRAIRQQASLDFLDEVDA
ncbi:SbcC/MukB-like Walker B domain-containing protein [Pseudomaricurvus sp. HS19]|uniref:ATP-binding protein n=1 Tax=Pseudomaricurvus sp. HS19 TaxID=2692626 RepID=UPI00136AD3B0|nr:hypothetical protein [Pseudomaricurvus sp. HS19]